MSSFAQGTRRKKNECAPRNSFPFSSARQRLEDVATTGPSPASVTANPVSSKSSRTPAAWTVSPRCTPPPGVNHQRSPSASRALNSRTRPSGSATRIRAVGRQMGVLLTKADITNAPFP